MERGDGKDIVLDDPAIKLEGHLSDFAARVAVDRISHGPAEDPPSTLQRKHAGFYGSFGAVDGHHVGLGAGGCGAADACRGADYADQADESTTF